jgi:NADH-quinone oxidoreductase subunit J
MTMDAAAFYLISAVILACGLLAVTSRKIFRSAIWLLFSLIGIAALYFLMDMQFLAAVQIIVYIGGIVVLIIFSIFLTQHTGADLPPALASRKAAGGLLSLAGFAGITYYLGRQSYNYSSSDPDVSLSAIGKMMLSTGEGGYVLPFEVISVLLLGAMIGCIVIALKLTQGQR